MMFSGELPNHRHRAFHKTGYQQAAATMATSTSIASTHPGTSLERDHRIVRQFHGPGVERSAEPQGFAYGSGVSYKAPSGGREQRAGRRQENGLLKKSSVERVKLRRQQVEAEADIKAHHEAVMKLQRERVTEKKQDLEMLQNYNPWGRPAAGAPRVTSQGEITTTRQKLEFAQPSKEEESEYNPFGRPGAGAPLRSDSGRVVTSLHMDPDTRFQRQLKQEVEGALRYREVNRREREQLLWEVQQQQREEQEMRFLRRTDSDKMRRVTEREKQLLYGRKLEQQRVEAMERKTKEKANKQVADSVYYPWGGDQVERDDSGKIPGRKWVVGKEADPDSGEVSKSMEYSNSKFVSLAALMGGPGGGGAPLRDREGNVHTKRSNVNVSTEGQPKDQFDPWGRPGAGAPNHSVDGHPVTTIYGKCYREKCGTDQPLVESIQDSRKAKEVENKRVLQGDGMDVASWLRAGVVGQPHRNSNTGEIVGTNKSTSDVTTERLKIRHSQPWSNRGYYTDLQRQAEKRQRNLLQQREMERRMDREHVEKTTKTWGGRWKDPARASGEEKEVQAVSRRKEYCSELQRMMADRSEQRRQDRERDKARERQHVESFAQQWGKPGAGAPRLNQHGHTDAIPKNFTSLLESQVYAGMNFRRA